MLDHGANVGPLASIRAAAICGAHHLPFLIGSAAHHPEALGGDWLIGEAAELYCPSRLPPFAFLDRQTLESKRPT